ncbi:MAG: P1 family peptidase [Pseudomonadota bacterium]
MDATEIRPGARNALCDVPGLVVGQAEDADRPTGVTVILAESAETRLTAAADSRGGGPGTRELDALRPESTVQEVHGLVLSGGSAFGLDAAGGVMDWLRQQGRGVEVGPARVPIVPAAILYDLALAERAGLPPMGWKDPPWWRLGRAAAQKAGRDIALGNAGAGMGAQAGTLKGGLGTASFTWRGITVAALVAANPLGSVTLPGMAHFWAWPWEQEAEFGGLPPPDRRPERLSYDLTRPPGSATSLAVIATDAALTRPQAKRLAIMGHDGLARAIRPIHSPLDGDTIFALSTGARPLSDPIGDLAILGMLAADCVARATARGVHAAAALADLPAWRDIARRRGFSEV